MVYLSNDHHQRFLIDFGGAAAVPSHWKISTNRAGTDYEDFIEIVLQKLLSESAASAA